LAKTNHPQSVTLAISVVVFLLLTLFPPWQQAAENEVDYRKDIGRGFVFRPPRTIPVDCYFVGCKQAPASYFHPVLYRYLWLHQLATVVAVALALLWLFRTRADGTYLGLSSPKVRFYFILFVALAIPMVGTFPFGSLLVLIPEELAYGGELGLLPIAMEIVAYLLCVLVIFGLVTATVRITGRSRLPQIDSRNGAI